MYNPFEAREWTGAWSQGAPEWRMLQTSDWERHGIKVTKI
jgi:hypothetical protein